MDDTQTTTELEKMTPTPHNEAPISGSEIPKKNFLSSEEALTFSEPGREAPTTPKNFPSRTRKREVKILPAHRIIFQNYKDLGFKSLGKAIRRTGVYSESVASRVNQITKSKSWQKLMEEYMPEEHLAHRHSELLDKRDTKTVEDIKYGEDGKIQEKVVRIVDMGPDTNAVTKGLEMAYRLRGSFTKDDTPPPSTVMYNLFYKPEVREQMKVFEDGLKQSLLNEINKRNLAEIEKDEENQNNLNSTGSGEHQEGDERPTADTTGGTGTESGVPVGDDGGGVSGVGQE